MSVFFINPFLGAVGGDFESIATVTVGSGGASTIEFNSIGSTYQHLQVRGISRNTGAINNALMYVYFNGVESGTAYAQHLLSGDGASATASASASTSGVPSSDTTGSSASASVFGAVVLDILDYASTSKNKTTRGLTGVDRNGGGTVRVTSGLWASTNAITSMRLYPASGNFAEHTTFALYGIKAP